MTTSANQTTITTDGNVLTGGDNNNDDKLPLIVGVSAGAGALVVIIAGLVVGLILMNRKR